MKIAMLSAISWRTPPKNYGPWELITSLLTESLIERGVEVTLYATGDSQTQGLLKSVVPQGYSEDKSLDAKVVECLHISQLMEEAYQYDLIHNQFDFLPLTYSKLMTVPMLTTVHGFSSAKILPVYMKYDNHTYYVSISDADRSPLLHYAKTIHHGINLTDFTFNEKGGDYLLFLGRIHPDKGTLEAIEIANMTNKKLIIAGIIQDEDYYKNKIYPQIDGNKINFIGPVGPKQRDKLLGNALALLHLINFSEPFGLSVVESMACGTPVIACNKGAMPELIKQGISGFLVDSVADACAKVLDIKTINRQACHHYANEKFSKQRMAENYYQLYQRIINQTIAPMDQPPSI
ncbi:MAG: glycosyltransferase family 4 protein [Gammaproteobacteria bacterium]|nr:glycosyltransferase family 4 protein [Gammaproteobacteria bacterium]